MTHQRNFPFIGSQSYVGKYAVHIGVLSSCCSTVSHAIAILSPTMTDMDLMTTKRTRFVVIRMMSLASRTQSSPIPAKHEKLMGPTAARLATKVNLKSPTRPIYQLRTTDHRKLFKRNTLRDAGSPNSSQ